jgi:hypothetical protein
MTQNLETVFTETELDPITEVTLQIKILQKIGADLFCQIGPKSLRSEVWTMGEVIKGIAEAYRLAAKIANQYQLPN